MPHIPPFISPTREVARGDKGGHTRRLIAVCCPDWLYIGKQEMYAAQASGGREIAGHGAVTERPPPCMSVVRRIT